MNGVYVCFSSLEHIWDACLWRAGHRRSGWACATHHARGCALMQTRRGLDLLLHKCSRLSQISPLLHDAHAQLTLLSRPVPSQEMQTWLAVVLSEHSGQHFIITLCQSNSAVDNEVALTNPSHQTRASPRLEAEGMRGVITCILRMCGLTQSVMRTPEKEAKEQRTSDDGAVVASQRQDRILSHHIAGCRQTRKHDGETSARRK